jgi:hypothetical protein
MGNNKTDGAVAELRKPALTRIFHESLAATTDMAVLPGVLGCRPLRRTVQVRKPIPRYRGTSCPVARPPRLSEQARDGGQARPSSSRSLRFRLRKSFDETSRSVPQAGSQFRGLATAIHEISGLERKLTKSQTRKDSGKVNA